MIIFGLSTSFKFCCTSSNVDVRPIIFFFFLLYPNIEYCENSLQSANSIKVNRIEVIVCVFSQDKNTC
jgi:hypothetical protein